MMKKKFFTAYKNPVTVLVVIIIMGGMFAYSKLQTALFPEITFPKIKIIADAGQQPVKKNDDYSYTAIRKCSKTSARFKNDSQHHKSWHLRNFCIHGLESKH